MSKIELYFGHPHKDSEWLIVEDYSLSQNINIESAAIQRFRELVSRLSATNEHGDNYFELGIFVEHNQFLKLPKFSTSTYKHKGCVLPKIVINGDYAVDKETLESVLISDTLINYIGNDFDREMGYDFHEFKRIGILNSSKNQIIYMIKEKPHIFHEGQFIEVKQ